MKTISQYMRANLRYFYAYISFHSFGQQLLFPYAYTAAHIFRYDDLVINCIDKNIVFEKYLFFLVHLYNFFSLNSLSNYSFFNNLMYHII